MADKIGFENSNVLTQAVVTTNTTTPSAITQSIATSGSPTGYSYTGAAHTTLANAEVIDVNWNLARTVQLTGGVGAIATQRAVLFQNPAYSAAAAQTITNAATVAILGAPSAGTNMTLTNPKALWV